MQVEGTVIRTTILKTPQFIILVKTTTACSLIIDCIDERKGIKN